MRCSKVYIALLPAPVAKMYTEKEIRDAFQHIVNVETSGVDPLFWGEPDIPSLCDSFIEINEHVFWVGINRLTSRLEPQCKTDYELLVEFANECVTEARQISQSVEDLLLVKLTASPSITEDDEVMRVFTKKTFMKELFLLLGLGDPSYAPKLTLLLIFGIGAYFYFS